MENVEKIMVTVKEFAKVSGLGERRVRDFARTADFPAIRAGKKILIHRERATEWLADYASGRKGAAAPV